MKREPLPAASSGSDRGESDRLDSWKDVAAYLKRDVSTVQRWERREGLPIHRHVHDKQGSVYAFRSELDVWQWARSREARGPGTSSTSGGSAEQVDANLETDTPSQDWVAEHATTVAPRSFAWFAGVASLVALAAATFAFGVARGRDTPFRPDIRSLVVLPLDDISQDPAHAYLAAGVTQELTARLAHIGGLRVVSTTSAIASKRRGVALPAIARDLRVDAAVEGTAQYHDGLVTVSIRLVHAPTDTHLWARDFEQAAVDLQQLLADAAGAVADEIRTQLPSDERARVVFVPDVDPKAHEEYLVGRYLLWKFVEEDRLRAIEHFQRAIRIAPEYAAPYAGLAHAWWMRGVLGPLTLKEVASPAREAALEALARDDHLADAYAAQAYVEGVFDWDWPGAEATIQRAVALEPNSVDAHYVYAILLMAMGRLDEALMQIKDAAQLDPLSAQVESTFGRILYRARRSDEAAERLTRAIELEPRNAGAVVRLADVYRQMERYDEALRTLDRARTLPSNRVASYRASLAITYARMGRAEDARELLPGLQGLAGGEAAVRTALGEDDAAFTLLFRAVTKREDWFPFIKADPNFEALHADRRWNELLQQMRLASDDDQRGCCG